MLSNAADRLADPSPALPPLPLSALHGPLYHLLGSQLCVITAFSSGLRVLHSGRLDSVRPCRRTSYADLGIGMAWDMC